MSPDSLLYVFVSLRSLHVLLAALWIGAATAMTVFLMPAIGNLAPEVASRLARGKFHPFMASIAGTTVLSGIVLYWHLTNGFSAVGMGSNAGLAFGIGGVIGLAALIIGGGVVGRSAKRIAELSAQAADANTRGSETIAEMDKLRQRVTGAGRLVVTLLVVSLILMTFGHYV